MKPSLILALPQKPATASYAHEAITCTLGNLPDECYICKDTFFVSTGCNPIRLSCGHVIGHECFDEWIDRYPETCPYWNHPLPSLPTRNKENWAASALKLPLLMPWMGAVESLAMRYPLFDLRGRLELYTVSQFHDAEDREHMYCVLSYSYITNMVALALSATIVCSTAMFLCSKAAAHCVSPASESRFLEFLFTDFKWAGFWIAAIVLISAQCYIHLMLLAMACKFWRERRRGIPSRFRAG